MYTSRHPKLNRTLEFGITICAVVYFVSCLIDTVVKIVEYFY